MSTDDFQTKYTSFMESVVKSTIGETTKLFETMVEELKAELSKVKTENEALKTTCRQMEAEKTQAISWSGQSRGPKMRDTAVQCELLPGDSVLEVQPVGQSIVQQNKQYNEEDLVYILLNDHNYYGAREKNALLNSEDSKPTMVTRNTLSAAADSTPIHACGSETENFGTSTHFLNIELRKKHATLVTTVHPNLENDYYLHEPQIKSVGTLKYPNSLTTINDSMDVAVRAGKRTAALGTQSCGSLTTTSQEQFEGSEAHIAQLSLKEAPVQEKACATLQQWSSVPHPDEWKVEQTLLDKQQEDEQIKLGLMEDETTWRTKGAVYKISKDGKQLSTEVKHLKKTLMTTLSPPTNCAGNAEQVKNLPSNCETVRPSSWVTEVSSGQTEKAVNVVSPSMEKRTSRTLENMENHNAAPLVVSVFSLSEDVLSSDSQHSSMGVKEAAIYAANSDITSAPTVLTRPTALSQQLLSCQPREISTSVTLHDAMLLDEATDQSKNCTSQEKATTHDHCTVSVATLPSVVQCLLPTQDVSPQLPPTANVCDKGTKEVFTNKTLFVKYPKEPNNSQSNVRFPLQHQEENGVTSDITATSLPLNAILSKSLDRDSYCTVGILAIPLQRMIVSEPVLNNIVDLPKSPSAHTQHTILPLSQSQISTIVSAVAAAHNKSTSSSLESSQCEYKVASSPVPPPVISDTTEQRPLSQKQIKIIIPRSVPFVPSQSLLSKTIDTLTVPNIAGPDITVPLSSQHPNICAKLTKDENEKPTSSSLQPNCSSQHTDTLENLQITPGKQTIVSTKSLSTNCSPVAPPIREERPPHVALLTKSLLASQGNKSVVPPDRTLVNDLVAKPTVSPADLNPISTVNGNVNCSSMPGKVLACTDIVGKPANCLPCTSVSELVLEESTIDFSKAEFSFGSDQAHKVAFILDEGNINNVDKELINKAIHDCGSLNSDSSPLQVRQNSKDLSDHSLQLIKNEFPAQLAVSPVLQVDQKASTNESTDAERVCDGTSTNSLTKSQKKPSADSPLPLKMQPQAKIRKTTPEPPRGKQGTQKSTKKPGLEDVITVEQETTNEHISIYTNTASLLSSTHLLTENVFSQVNISNQQSTDLRSDENRSTFEVISVHNQNPSLSKHSPSPKDSTDKTLNIPPLTHSEINISHVNSYSLKIEDTFETITKNSEKPFRAQDLTSKTFESTIYPKSKLTRRTTDMATIKSPLSSYTIRRLGLTNNKPGLTETRLRSSITKDTTPLKHKLTPESHKNCVSGKVSSCVKKTKISCPQDQSSLRVTTPPPRSRLTRNSTSPKECQLPPFGHNRSSSTKYVPVPKTPYCESLRSYTFSKEYTSKQMTRQSSSLLGKTASSSAGRPQMAKNSLSNTRESSAKKSRLNSPCSTLKNTVKIQNVKELTNLTKAQTIGTSLRETRSSLLPIQRDKRTPRAQNNFSVSPPTLSHQLIRIKAPNVVPPVQPLAVIGERLLKNQCGECGRVLSSSAALESHVSLHTGHRPFSCTLCGKSFPDAKGLKRHVRVHRNERIHICQQCGKDFIYGFGLTKHIQMVHGKIKPFACQICNKTFFTKRDVEIHLRIHTGEKPFHCDLCERKFTRKVELNVHLRWHNGEKRHWCPYCGKRFLDYNNLKRHKYIHTGEKPHSCPHCPKHFTQSGHLKKHVKNVHKVV